jgi:hypothetical protein
MNYKLGRYMAENDTFMFNFDDGRWIEIDFAEYPNYQILSNTLDNDEWYFTIIDNGIDNDISDSIGDSIGDNNDKTIGAVKLFNYRELRQIETNIKSFRKNGILYRKSTQTELDHFLLQKDDNDNDNGKLFKLFDTLYNEPKIEITMV